MSAIIMDFRVREEMAGAVLKEVAALEPAERLQEAHSLTQIIGQALQGLEQLWEDRRESLRGGVSPSDAATLGRIVIRTANFFESSLDLLVGENSSLAEYKQEIRMRLQCLNTRAAALRRLVELPAPAPDPERLRRSVDQMERGEAVDAEDLLAELKG